MNGLISRLLKRQKVEFVARLQEQQAEEQELFQKYTGWKCNSDLKS